MSSANVILKISHSGLEDRSVKMAMRNFFIVVVLSSLVALIDGFELRGRSEPTAEECMKPPMSKFGHECCRLPKERIWGDLRPSMTSCFRKMKEERRGMRQEMPDDRREPMTPETLDGVTPTEVPGDSGAFPSTSPRVPGPGKPGRRPHHFRRHGNDSCFMECVFEDQGFLTNKMVNKAALLDRLGLTLAQNDLWRNAAMSAVETCYQRQMEVPSNKTCQSGSEEIFRCIFKQIFFNCPNWTPSDYCTALKEFYEKCPDAPPPEIADNHSTSPAPPPTLDEATDMNASTETDSEAE